MSKMVVTAGWEDVPHLDEQVKKELLDATPPHLKDSRSKGTPGLGAGAVYPIPVDDIKFDVGTLQIPPWWRRAYGLDVGWNNTACVFGAYDLDSDIWYIYDGFKRGQCEPEIHASAIRKRYPNGMALPGCIDPAAAGSSQLDGRNLMHLYRVQEKLKLRPADNSVEAGVTTMWSRLSTGGLKIARHLTDWFEEYSIYRRREDGKIIKEHDHYMDATRYLMMTGAKIAKSVETKEVVNAGGRRYF